MRTITRNVAAIAAMLVVTAALAAAQDKVDLTGTWVFTVQTDAGSGAPTFTLKQDGEKLSGTYSGQFGEADVTGTVKGKDFTINFSADAQGTKLDMTYKGTVESKDAVKGTLNIAGLGEGTFTGKRQ